MRAWEIWATTATSGNTLIKLTQVLHYDIAQSVVAALVRQGHSAEAREVNIQNTERQR